MYLTMGITHIRVFSSAFKKYSDYASISWRKEGVVKGEMKTITVPNLEEYENFKGI
ncbi:MAG: hypothetical protein RR448_12055 [Niameybacter sp.]